MVHVMTLAGIFSISYAQSSNYNPTLNAKEKQSIEAGEVIMRELETKHDKGQTIETIGMMNVPGEFLVRVLTDYEAYPRFMSAIDNVEIVGQERFTATLNYILKPMLGLNKKYRIKIAPAKLDEQVWIIEWHLVPWPELKSMETITDTKGYWLIIEQNDNRCIVQYYVYSDPSPVPFGLGGIVNKLGRDSIKNVFNETRTHVEKTVTPSDP